MWLIISSFAAIAATAFWFFTPRRYRVGELALMLWGLSLFVFVDHVLGYEGGSFIEMRADGLIENGTVLGLAMLIPVFLIWEMKLAYHKVKGEVTV